MKKLLLALTLVLSLLTAKAGGFGLSLGPKFGYQTAKLSLNKVDIKDGFKNHWTAGLFVRVHFGGFVIQPELMYFKSDKVFNIAGVDASQSQFVPTITLNQQNLSLPINLGYMFDWELLKLRLTAAPVMYFVVGQNQTSSDGSIIAPIETQKLTWGAALNAGIDIWHFTLDVSYTFGLTNVFKNDNFNIGDYNVQLDSRQNMFMVTLGFRLLD